MKRGTVDHPKTHALAAALNIQRWGAVGILESLWHFTAQYAVAGDVGRHQDDSIARAICWDGASIVLIKALVESGWVDQCACHRLRIHDWKEHADQTVQRVLKNRAQSFVACYDDPSSRLASSYPAVAVAVAKPLPLPIPVSSEAAVVAVDSKPATEIVVDPTTEAFLLAYNAAFGRLSGSTPLLEKRIKARLKEGFHRWQIVALPIIVAGSGTWVPTTPDVLLRDGKHSRTMAGGVTAGATDHLNVSLQKIDKVILTPKLQAAAERVGVLEPLLKMQAKCLSGEAV